MSDPARLTGAKITPPTPQPKPVSNAAIVDGPKMNFSAALDIMKAGELVARLGWNGKDMHIGIRVPTETGQLSYIYMLTVDGAIVPWVASHTDLLADDWVFA